MEDADQSCGTPPAATPPLPAAPVPKTMQPTAVPQRTPPPLAPPLSAELHRLEPALLARLPQADILQLGQGYLVVRRRHLQQQQRPTHRPASASPGPYSRSNEGASNARLPSHEARYLQQLQRLRLLARLRLVIPDGLAVAAAAVEAGFWEALAATLDAARALPAQRPISPY